MQLLRKILWPVSLLYGAGVYLRNLTYDLGIRSTTSFSTSTISVGNLSLGGTGKTPMIEWLIRHLGNEKNIAVLSRGYRRKTSGFLIADSNSSAADIGDEPMQIHKKFPHITMAVDANRRRGIQHLEAHIKPDLILLDDAFQHRKVQPAMSILLTTYDCLYTDDWFLPTGTLRDARNQSKRADLIVVTKCPASLSESEMKAIEKKVHSTADQEVLFCTLEYNPEILGSRYKLEIEELRNQTITLVTGIANPKPLKEFLSGQGLDIRHIQYSDHHDFSRKEIARLENEAFVITTEKDYMRGLNDLARVGYVEVRHKFLADGRERLLRRIDQLGS